MFSCLLLPRENNEQTKETHREKEVGGTCSSFGIDGSMDGLQYSLAVHGKKKKVNNQKEHFGSN